MKAFKKHWCVKPLSYMLSLYLLVLPLVLTLLAGGNRAQAQVIDLTRTALPQWAVLDFSNDAGYGGAEIGRQASDSFVLELGKTNKIDVVPRQQILGSIQNLGLTLPLDTVATQKLGRDLNVDAVVTGSVATVAFDNSPRRATAGVIVRVVDTNTGLLINGAIATGTSTPRPIPTNDDDALVNQAIDNATFAAVRQIINYSLPRATVMQDEDENTVLLNKGTKDGLYDGLDMVVTRHGSEVGRVRVSRAGTDNSDAVVTVRGAGIAPEDVATAIFQLPHFSYSGDHRHITAASGAVAADTVGSGSSTKRSQFSGIGGILASILIGALLLSLVKRGNGSGALGGGQIGSPTAVEVGAYDPSGTPVVGGQAPGLQSIHTEEGDTIASIQDYSPVAMHITASHGNVDPFLLQEYHVFRPDFNGNPLVEFAPVGRALTTKQIANTPGQIAILSQASPNLDQWDDGADHSINYTTLGAVSQTTVNITSDGNYALGSGIHQNIMGKRWSYGVEALWQNTNGSSSGLLPPGNPNGFALTARSSTNPVTYLQPVDLHDGGSGSTLVGFTGVSPNKVFLTLNAVMTADDYILEISDTPAFARKQTFKPFNPGLIATNVATTLAPRGGPIFPFFDPNVGVNMATVDSQLGNAPALYARVGVRDSRNGSNTKYNPYLYSQTLTIPSALI